jgi:short-subunit dehydrogenase
MEKTDRAYAVITGAGGGLGGAFALEAARMGWNLLLVDLPGSGVGEAGRRLSRAYRIEARGVEMDITGAGDRSRLLESIRSDGIRCGLLVNNAGTMFMSAFAETPLPALADIVEVNVQALMQMTYLLLPELKRRERASILNVASLAAFYPMPCMAVYAASKAFILSFSLAIREELAGTGVTVSALCPAGMITNRESADQVRAQGFFGRITTWYPERVAAKALRQALKGRDLIIPGAVNRILRLAGAAVPRRMAARYIGGRWRKARLAVQA